MAGDSELVQQFLKENLENRKVGPLELWLPCHSKAFQKAWDWSKGVFQCFLKLFNN